jgi:hypothetical protein
MTSDYFFHFLGEGRAQGWSMSGWWAFWGLMVEE